MIPRIVVTHLPDTFLTSAFFFRLAHPSLPSPPRLQSVFPLFVALLPYFLELVCYLLSFDVVLLQLRIALCDATRFTSKNDGFYDEMESIGQSEWNQKKS